MISSNKIFDSILVIQYQSGDKKALAILVKRWHVKFCKQAYWYTNDIEVSKDIAQDSWSKICVKIHQLKDPDNFGSWALTIVTRNTMDWLRKHKKELNDLNTYKEQQQETTTYDKEEEVKPLMKELKKLIEGLPKQQQIVLHLFYIEGYSVKQIGRILKISEGTVKSRLFTAREKLKLILKHRNYEK